MCVGLKAFICKKKIDLVLALNRFEKTPAIAWAITVAQAAP